MPAMKSKYYMNANLKLYFRIDPAQPHLRSVVRELRDRFDSYLKTGNQSSVPADLLAVAYRIVSLQLKRATRASRC
jgi:hypothetical protein